ncbi:hypothetical protein TrVE_jg6887 [Triparma verrucosa]|uniref:Uncharacterized protein n=1 Tax=Triparma verrucosa TaxID=1606542 RepID=A0A9W7BI90_9STRA|nr:hypothetical protein TrVE_jg6887 [Triparma verrucosa]
MASPSAPANSTSTFSPATPPPVPPHGALRNNQTPLSAPSPACASEPNYTPPPPALQSKSKPITRTAKKQIRLQWMNDGKSIAARVKSVEAECKTTQDRFCPGFKGTVVEAKMEYKKSIGRLRSYANIAKSALTQMSSSSLASGGGGKDLKELNKRCEAAVSSYERDVQAVAERVRVEGVRLDRDGRDLEQFLDGCEHKFKRWESGEVTSNTPVDFEVKVPSVTATSVPEAFEMSEITSGPSLRAKIDKNEDEAKRTLMKGAEFKRRITRIDNLINSDGGKTGTWHADEHAGFLKAWTRCGGDVDVIVKAVREHAALLRNRKDPEIVSHAAWYVVYLSRCSEKKELAERWRRWKNDERERKVEVGLKEIEELTAESAKKKDPELTKEQVREAQRQQKEAIRAWKEEKEREKENARAEKEQREQEEKLKWEQKQEKHRYLRARVNDYKAQKEREEERDKKIKSLADKTNVARRFSREEIERRREEEINGVKKKRLEKERREREKQFEAARLRAAAKGVNETVVRDFNRLTGDTKASGARAYTNEELDDLDEGKKIRKAHDKPIFYSARDLAVGGGRRAVPTWRGGII